MPDHSEQSHSRVDLKAVLTEDLLQTSGKRCAGFKAAIRSAVNISTHESYIFGQKMKFCPAVSASLR